MYKRQWQNSSGGSFWVWYGQYRLLSDLIWGRPYYYSSWHYNRPWSYYNDYGRNIYSSNKQRSQYKNVHAQNDRQVKQYGARTGRNHSAYSNNRTNKNFKPSSASKSASTRSRSVYSSSHRSSSRSRGRFGGNIWRQLWLF